MKTLKTPAFKIGELLVIPIGHRFGFARVIHKEPNFGYLFEVYEGISTGPDIPDLEPKVLDVAYVNHSSVRKKWKSNRIGNPELIVTPELPILFYGDPRSGWTVEDKDKKTFFAAGSGTRADFRNKGYINQVLWLAKDIEDLIEFGKPLIWPSENELTQPKS